MTIKLLTVSCGRHTDGILRRLCEQAGDALELVAHFGDRNADFKASSLTRLNAVKGRDGHLLHDGSYSGANRPLVDGAGFADGMVQFIDHLQRSAPTVIHLGHELGSIHEFQDYYHIVSDAVAALFAARGVNQVLFLNVPHLAFDTIMYQVAKALGVPMLIVTQSLFPDRYFSMDDIASYGLLDAPAFAIDGPRHPIDRAQNLDLFYMGAIGRDAGQRGRLSAKSLGQLLLFLLAQRPAKLLDPAYVWSLARRMHRIEAAFPRWRDPFARFFHTDQLAYFEHLAQYEDRPVDLERKFVYFPLQLQPEMTTSALGGRYVDQALAIEHLSTMLPPDFRIYVKENPKQGAHMRGPMFFHRLRRIPKVHIVPSHADTVALTARAQFVATITGTVGWEAIRKGRKALVFGDTWYQQFPGVFRFRPELNVDDILRHEIDHDLLERTVGALLARSHRGVIERHYRKIVPDYDAAANAERIAQTLWGLLQGNERPLFVGGGPTTT